MTMEPSTFFNLLVTAITALAAVVSYLFFLIMANHKKTTEKLDECEKDRNKLWGSVHQLEAKLGINDG